jgi:tetratricopeptide (TPR) repeat protein
MAPVAVVVVVAAGVAAPSPARAAAGSPQEAAGSPQEAAGSPQEAAGSPQQKDRPQNQNQKKKEPASGRQVSKLPPSYDEGMKLIRTGEYAKAREIFEQALREASSNPDVLNMLAYSQRKTGSIDLAIETHKRALRLRPNFPQARESLGEAYLQASLRELTALQRAGRSATSEHAMLLRALHEALEELPPAPEGSGRRW